MLILSLTALPLKSANILWLFPLQTLSGFPVKQYQCFIYIIRIGINVSITYKNLFQVSEGLNVYIQNMQLLYHEHLMLQPMVTLTEAVQSK